MPKFYFTYGTSPAYPFQGGWTEVEAPDRPTACKLFQVYHPTRPGSAGRLNYADVYSDEAFKQTGMYSAGNFGFRCQERIDLSREVLRAENGDASSVDKLVIVCTSKRDSGDFYPKLDVEAKGYISPAAMAILITNIIAIGQNQFGSSFLSLLDKALSTSVESGES